MRGLTFGVPFVVVTACATPYGTAPGPSTPPGCDLSFLPRDAPACVDESVGLFVSPTGIDRAIGSRAAPLKTIQTAIDRATQSNYARVYVCAGDYVELVQIGAGVSVYGGFSCTDWTYTGDHARIVPPMGVGLTIRGVTGGSLTVADFDILGAPPTGAKGETSIAAFVSKSDGVSFVSSSLTAAAGVAGLEGITGTNYPAGAAASGANSSNSKGGKGALCTCADGTSSEGGTGADGNGSGATSGAAMPVVGVDNTGTSSTMTCGAGQGGDDGAQTGAGAKATSRGIVTADGWTPTAAVVDAPSGFPGQGGGGGGARTQLFSGGGAGGCGGCGGAGGSGGSPGGSSFALLVFSSTVTLDSSSLVAGSGGAGGAGAPGQDGQAGGAPGSGACSGGGGGPGSGGTGGSGGPGGHSAGVGYSGSPPQLLSTQVTFAPPSQGGPGGARGGGVGMPGLAGLDGEDGSAQEMLELP